MSQPPLDRVSLRLSEILADLDLLSVQLEELEVRAMSATKQATVLEGQLEEAQVHLQEITHKNDTLHYQLCEEAEAKKKLQKQLTVQSPESLLSSKSSDDGVENNASSGSAEGFLCPDCFLAYPNADDLHNHYESAHSNKDNAGEKKFNCPACKMKLGSEIELQSHFTRNHSDRKEDVELRAMTMQVKALEEGKALLQTELQSVLMDRTKLKEEKDILEQKAAKLASDLADLKLNFDELNSRKMYLESALKISEERVSKLEVEMQQRPEEDYVIELKKGIKSVQEKMNELALQKEDEKDSLQKLYNELQESSLNLQGKISEMSVTISNLKEELSSKEVEKTKLQVSLEKFENYEEIKVTLAEKLNSVEELLRQSNEKDSQISKLKEELNEIKDEVEGSKNERERLFSEIAKGEGANTAMLQLKEENTHLQQQFLNQQTIHLKAIDETGRSMDELRKSLRKTESELLASNEKCVSLEKTLKECEGKLKQIQAEKDAISKELNLQLQGFKKTADDETHQAAALEETCKKQAKDLELLHRQIDILSSKNAELSKSKKKLQSEIKPNEEFLARKIFIGGLSKISSISSIKRHFSTFGKVIGVEMPLDSTNQRKSFCFVIFENSEACRAALAEPKQKIDSKMCDVELAKSGHM